MLFPGPGGGEGVLDRALGLPAQFFVGEGGVGPDGDYITRTTRGELIIQLDAVYFLKGSYQLIHRDRTSCADIEYLITLFHLAVKHPGYGSDVSFGKVNHIDIVTEAGAVFSRIDISEYAETLTFSDGSLGDERNEIVRNATREFAYKCRRMSTYRVEVAEGDSLYRALSVSSVKA